MRRFWRRRLSFNADVLLSSPYNRKERDVKVEHHYYIRGRAGVNWWGAQITGIISKYWAATDDNSYLYIIYIDVYNDHQNDQ